MSQCGRKDSSWYIFMFYLVYQCPKILFRLCFELIFPYFDWVGHLFEILNCGVATSKDHSVVAPLAQGDHLQRIVVSLATRSLQPQQKATRLTRPVSWPLNHVAVLAPWSRMRPSKTREANLARASPASTHLHRSKWLDICASSVSYSLKRNLMSRDSNRWCHTGVGLNCIG